MGEREPGENVGQEPGRPEPDEVKGKDKRPSGIAIAAFLLSLAIALTGLWQWYLGPQIEVLEPEEVWLYRQESGEKTSLAMAVNLPMINRASAYNDVVLGLTLQPWEDGPALPVTDVARVVRTYRKDPAVSREFCVQGWRCHPLSGLAVSETSETLVPVPAGGAHANYYTFRLICPPDVEQCGLGLSDTSIKTLKSKRLKLVIRVRLHRAGEKTIRCNLAASDLKYFSDYSWETLYCER